jgi:signal transduction histidine kinase
MSPLTPLVNLVSRVPARVEIKLWAAFLAITVLLIAMGAVALQIVSGINERTEGLIKLERKIEAYRQVQNDTTTQLYTVSSALLSSDERTLESTLRQLTQFGYDMDRVEFVANDEMELLGQIREDYDRFVDVVTQAIELIRGGRAADARELQITQASPIADRLERLTNQLVHRAEADMVTGIETSNQAYAVSRTVVMSFAVATIVLAIVLGYAISKSLTGPLMRVEARLKEIAGGEFSHRLDVVNRDELGALAANVNRMSEELGRLYRQLEAANLAKSRFLAAASHDLRQPLHALNLFVAQLCGETDPAEQKRLLPQIEATVRAMNELFNGLWDLSRLDAEVLVPNLSEFPIDRLLKRIELTCAPAAREKGLRLKVISNPAYIRSDRVLLERVLLNLVSNAIRYTVKGGVAAGCRRRGDTLRIEVWDTGVGIAEDQRGKIFGEFYRGPANEQDRSGGAGLGLAIVDRMCRLLHHPIGLTSRLGSGTRFSISVPIAAPRGQPQQAAQVVGDRLAGKVVLVIDDDAVVLDGMSGVLRSWGCLVLTACSEPEALSCVAEQDRKPDLIISDYWLAEGARGIQVIDRLRQVLATPVSALLISGDTVPERLQEARARGYYMLHKPVMPMTLRTMLNRLLKDTSIASHRNTP